MTLRTRFAAALLSASSFGAPAALAQAVTATFNIGDAVRESAPAAPPVEKPAEAPVLPEFKDEPLVLPEGGTLHVRDFRLDGVAPQDEAEVQALLEPFRNRDLTLADIYRAATIVTNWHRERGYMVAKAYVPQQDARNGTLILKVVQGRFGKVTIHNDSVVHDFMLQGTAEAAMPAGETVTRDGVERAMMRISNMPGAGMPKVTASPGQDASGFPDFVLDVPSGRRLTGYLLGDNEGSRYTGKHRADFGLIVNAPFGLGDQLSLSGRDAEAGGLQNWRAAYTFPLWDDGKWRASVAATRTTYRLGDIYRDLEASGTATGWEAGVSYEFEHTWRDLTALTLTAASQNLHDKLSGEVMNDRTAQTASLALQKTMRGVEVFGFDTTVDLLPGLHVARVDYDDPAEEAQNKAGADSAGTTTWADLQANASVAFDEDWSLKAGLRAQHVLKDKNLDGLHQIGISGSTGVRSYAEGVSGDNGYVAHLEGQYALPAFDAFKHSVGLFGDLGRVWLQNDDYTGEGSGTRLSDVGLGYYASFDYLDGRLLLASLRFVHTVGPQQETGERNARAKVLGQIGLTF